MAVLVCKLALWIGDSNPEEIIGGLGHRQAAEIHSRLTEAMERARMSDKCVNGAKLDLKKRFDSVAPLQAIRGGTLMGAPSQAVKKWDRTPTCRSTDESSAKELFIQDL